MYAPVDGELANLYIAEGQPVSRATWSRGSMRAARSKRRATRCEAQLKLEDAEREWKQFPEKKALLERARPRSRQAMELEEQQHQSAWPKAPASSSKRQKAQMQEARTNLERCAPRARCRQARGGQVRAPVRDARRRRRVAAAGRKQEERAAGGGERAAGGAIAASAN